MTIADLLQGCGFDAAGYLSDNSDLRAAGFDTRAAMGHFLEFGLDEHRLPIAGVFPLGLATLAGAEIADEGYAARLMRAVFMAQRRNPATSACLWQGIAAEAIAALRRRGGLAYVVFGDSHAGHYERFAQHAAGWFAPMALQCHGGTAIHLAEPEANNGYGGHILRWAEASGPRWDVPIFLKFGGIDTDYLWAHHRIRAREFAYSREGFEAFANKSVAAYARFIDRLCGVIDRACLRICSVFPPTLRDGMWKDAFRAVHQAPLARDPEFADGLARLEVPDFHTRTGLRAAYNARLGAICADRGIVFVDDFTALLDATGQLQDRYFPQQGEDIRHLGFAATHAPLSAVINRYLRPQ